MELPGDEEAGQQAPAAEAAPQKPQVQEDQEHRDEINAVGQDVQKRIAKLTVRLPMSHAAVAAGSVVVYQLAKGSAAAPAVATDRGRPCVEMKDVGAYSVIHVACPQGSQNSAALPALGQ